MSRQATQKIAKDPTILPVTVEREAKGLGILLGAEDDEGSNNRAIVVAARGA